MLWVGILPVSEGILYNHPVAMKLKKGLAYLRVAQTLLLLALPRRKLRPAQNRLERGGGLGPAPCNVGREKAADACDSSRRGTEEALQGNLANQPTGH